MIRPSRNAAVHGQGLQLRALWTPALGTLLAVLAAHVLAGPILVRG